MTRREIQAERKRLIELLRKAKREQAEIREDLRSLSRRCEREHGHVYQGGDPFCVICGYNSES